MLRVSIEAQTEFDTKRGNEPANDYLRVEIPGVCEIFYKQSNQSLIIVRPDEEDQEQNP